MKIIFNYRKERGIFGKIYRPVADIEIQKSDGRWVEFHPYIDSGADITLVPYTIGAVSWFQCTH